MYKPYNELNEIEKIERELFLLECKDCWTRRDWAKDAELKRQLQALKENIDK